MKRLGCLLVVLSLFACVGEDPLPATSPTADIDAGAGADGGDGGPAECATPARCADDGRSLVTCKGTIACGLGCDVASGRCKSIAPSGAAGGANTSGANALATLEGGSTYWFDTATGIIGLRDETGTPTGLPLRAGGTGVVAGIGFEAVTQTDGSKIGVWSFGSLTIKKGAVVAVFGVDALAIVTQGDLVVDGTVRVSGDCAKNVPGPGAAAQVSALTGKVGEMKLTNPGFKYICAGGGGGGNGAAGGDGGFALGTNSEGATYQSLGGGRGAARGKTLIDEPLLVGGGSGGSGGDGDNNNDAVVTGGAGGGAVQLVASGTLTVSGLVDAGGCGGKRGWGGAAPINTAVCRGAGGGGAGGAIFLEASTIHVTSTGRILANGGGGGGGSTSYTKPNDPQQNTDGAANAVDGARALGGQADVRRAAPGSCGPGQNGNPPVDQTEPYAQPCAVGDIAVAASGGGGGFGTIAVRTPDATFLTDEGGVVNPAPARSIAAVR